METIKYKASGRYKDDSWQVDIFNTKESAEFWLKGEIEGIGAFDEVLPIEEVVASFKCDKCGCESRTLDDDLNYDDTLEEHFRDCSTLLEDEPNLD